MFGNEKRERRAGGCLEFLQPDISDIDAAKAELLDRNADQTLGSEIRGIIVDQNRHDMAVDDVRDLMSTRDDVELIPFILFDERHQRGRIAKAADDSRALAGFRFDDAAAPGQFPPRCAAILDVAAVLAVIVVVEAGTEE